MNLSTYFYCLMMSFHRIFVYVRSEINNPINGILLTTINRYIVEVLNENYLDFNIFKKDIMNILNNDTSNQEFFERALNFNNALYTDNVGEIIRYLPIIRETILESCKYLKENNFDRAYDLIDMIHALPDAILYKKEWNDRKFWKTYIKPYRKKWINQFLLENEKKLVKKGIFI